MKPTSVPAAALVCCALLVANSMFGGLTIPKTVADGTNSLFGNLDVAFSGYFDATVSDDESVVTVSLLLENHSGTNGYINGDIAGFGFNLPDYLSFSNWQPIPTQTPTGSNLPRDNSTRFLTTEFFYFYGSTEETQQVFGSTDFGAFAHTPWWQWWADNSISPERSALFQINFDVDEPLPDNFSAWSFFDEDLRNRGGEFGLLVKFDDIYGRDANGKKIKKKKKHHYYNKVGVNPVPEPSVILLGTTAALLGGFVIMRRLRRK